MTMTDHQVQKLRKLCLIEKLSLPIAAVKSGMSEKTARKYMRNGLLPSESKKPRDWKTRQDPFEAIWPSVLVLLEVHPKIEAKTLFEEIQRRYPGRFEEGQLRTFQRRVKNWRIEYGDSKEVSFEQVHEPGRLCQSDFTCMNELGVTIQGRSFEHLLYHFALTYSNWECASICYSESFESLAEGLTAALKQLDGVPKSHRTDNLAAAKKIGKPEFQERYAALMVHLGLDFETTNPYSGNENGDVEQSHHRLKRTVDQALMLRNSRDFESIQAYQHFLEQVMRKQNLKRKEKLELERPVLKPLPQTEWMTCSHQRVRVSKANTIQAKHKTYSVSSRLIGQVVDVYVYGQHRQQRLVDLNTFLKMAAEPGTVVLDSRSAAAFARKHIQGAVHLNFSDFTAAKLAAVIPDKNTRILIYCNNNLEDDNQNFPAKSMPLALNIPNFINLYGYGYTNIYELASLVSVSDPRLVFAGSSVP